MVDSAKGCVWKKKKKKSHTEKRSVYVKTEGCVREGSVLIRSITVLWVRGGGDIGKGWRPLHSSFVYLRNGFSQPVV